MGKNNGWQGISCFLFALKTDKSMNGIFEVLLFSQKQQSMRKHPFNMIKYAKEQLDIEGNQLK
ncbi:MULTISPECIES: hypothetical protein [unclassified Bacillus (in: firmicutes)]|uniref:hypothetical protein n=1 Tax=unclassified Bacillus (in: firmicutes) TaxID=185979 RepID=UPI0008E18825|nr:MULTISPECIES: hypothetical protein [unclassified Bacillus (in: firmicutes)]SFA98279.1 hypothetical protein SAMN02799634_103336 [Bacillus sp. UNCCL13]SFQ80943.1 hypothetical protein SAMN04488577_1965 [Bacillus sp. cl95]